MEVIYVGPKFITRVIITLIAALMLFGSVLDGLPYAYFKVLRVVVCGTSVYRGVLSFENKQKIWGRIFIVLVVLFNPVRPVQFTQEVWMPIDILTGFIMLASIPMLKKIKK